MFKAIYAEVRQGESTESFRLVGVFDKSFSQSVGIDDADYSQIDSLVKLLSTEEKVGTKKYNSLRAVRARLKTIPKTSKG